jgi:hypothetical protein
LKSDFFNEIGAKRTDVTLPTDTPYGSRTVIRAIAIRWHSFAKNPSMQETNVMESVLGRDSVGTDLRLEGPPDYVPPMSHALVDRQIQIFFATVILLTQPASLEAVVLKSAGLDRELDSSCPALGGKPDLTRRKNMRLAVALVGLIGLVGVASAAAAPSPPDLAARQDTSIVRAAWGCGWGYHPGHWGYCVPNGYAYYGHPHWRPHYWHHRHYW